MPAYRVTPEPDIVAHQLPADDPFPNNASLPLLLYQQAVQAEDGDAAGAFEQLFEQTGWGGSWRNGVFAYHHYHSNAHEVLGIGAGQASLQFGGPNGPTFEVAAGDVVILPAGTAHKKLSSSDDFLVVGAYPAGQESYDTLRGEANERSGAERRIARVPLPKADPVYGSDGALMDYWYEQ